MTGIVGGQNDGLFGGGPPRMQSDIECDDLDAFNTVADGQKVSIIGTCEGKDQYGMIHLSDCRVAK